MNLTQAAKITRIFIIVFFVTFMLGTSTYIGYKIWYSHYLASLPAPEEKADPKFGVLKLPILPQSDVSSSNYAYTIDTNTGNLPDFGKITKVFIMPPVTSTLLAGEKSQNLALKFNLDPNPQIISETKYKYQSTSASLTINLDTGNFVYQKEASPSTLETITDNENQLINNFKISLNQLGILNDQLKNGPSVITFLDTDKKTALISLWPQDLDKKQILSPYPNKSLVNAKVTKSASDLSNYLSMEVTFWPIDISSYATYPIKSSSEAFDDLRSGNGTIIIVPPSPKVSITDMALTYFQSDQYSPYLQPIYVFTGPNFTAYVAAISNSYLDLTK